MDTIITIPKEELDTVSKKTVLEDWEPQPEPMRSERILLRLPFGFFVGKNYTP